MQEVAAATQEQQESYKDDLVDESGEEDAELNAETNVCVSLVTFIALDLRLQYWWLFKVFFI